MKRKKSNQQHAVQIIAGQFRHRKIAVIEADDLRPTAARIRETLFNWLSPVIAEKNCLDLFAGSGILGFEALSRQANHVTFVEKNRAVSQQIKKNINTLNITNANVINADYQQAVTGQYDVIFLDPPYSLRLLPAVLEQVIVLRPQHIFIEDNQPLEPQINENLPYELIKSKKAGGIYYGLLAAT